MEEVVLELEPREVTGKAVKHLRAEGMVPAVIHDHGKDSVIVMGQYIDLVKAYQRAGKHHPVNVKAGKKHYMALIKSVDFEPKKRKLRHVVFNAIKANEKTEAEIPLRIRYDEGNDATPAERTGLVVLHQLEAVAVEALPKNLPEFIEFNGEKLIEVGDHVTVADLIVPEGVTVKADPTHPVATVFEPSALQAANDAAGGTAEAEEETPAGESEEGTAEGAASDNAKGSEEKTESK